VQGQLQGSFGWFELYLGLLIALIVVGAASYAAYLWRERRRKRDEFRTAHNLEHNIDPRFLARLLGEVGSYLGPSFKILLPRTMVSFSLCTHIKYYQC